MFSRRASLALALLLTHGAPAFAQSGFRLHYSSSDEGVDAATAPVDRWRSVLEPQLVRSERLVNEAETLLASAPTIDEHQYYAQLTRRAALGPYETARLGQLRAQAVAEAGRRVDAALALTPSYGPALYLRAQSLDEARPRRARNDAADRAIAAAYESALGALALSDPRSRDALFSLGVAYTRLMRFTEARDTYLRLTRAYPTQGVAHCNLAEVQMYLGALDASIASYRDCEAHIEGRATAQWGLAIAHDRVGQEADARRAADAAMQRPDAMEDITGEGIFYVPEYEEHYYLGVAYEARARAAEPSARRAALLEALSSWRRYLTDGAQSTARNPQEREAFRGTRVRLSDAPLEAPWSDRARAHAAAVEAELATMVRETTVSPRASRGRR